MGAKKKTATKTKTKPLPEITVTMAGGNVYVSVNTEARLTVCDYAGVRTSDMKPDKSVAVKFTVSGTA